MKPLLLTLAIARGLDLASTQVVLQQGGREANPLLPQSAPWNLAIGAGATAGEVVALHALARRHPTAAKWLAVAAVTFEAGVAAKNFAAVRR